MDITALFIDAETDGAVPLRCEVIRKGKHLQIKCNGDRGFIIELPIEKLEIILADDLHG